MRLTIGRGFPQTTIITCATAFLKRNKNDDILFACWLVEVSGGYIYFKLW